jgi:N-acetylmuramoyl-L-alanine amidase
MAARWVGVSRPHNKKTAAHRGLTHTIRECVHALGVCGVLAMAASFNFAMNPEALASVVGEHAIIETVPEGSAPVPVQPVVNEDEVRLLAATVWGEARSEGEDGMRAVAHVMVNRIGDRFGEDLATVILTPKQFSVWNRGDPNRRLVLNLVRDPDRYVTDAAQWEQAQRIAREVLAGQSVDPTDGALFYHTRGVRPSWARYGVGRQTIGYHIFYADVPDSGQRRTPRVTNVAHIFGRPMLIEPSTGARGVNAAATPTLDGVPITQLQRGTAATH